MANPQRKRVSFAISHSQPDILAVSSLQNKYRHGSEEYQENCVQSQPLDCSSIKGGEFKTSRDKLIDFLDKPQEPFVSSHRATTSTGTRQPKFFDLHLHPDLQLRKIVVVDDLPRQIAKFCDGFLSKYLIHLSTSAALPEYTKDLEEKKDASIFDERSLAFSYSTKVGNPLANISSTLIFEINHYEAVFGYRLSSPDSSAGLNFAKPDGFLCLDSEAMETSSKMLPAKHVDDINLIMKHNLHCMALWEFKNLISGSKKAMEFFVKLEGDFAWSMCTK